MTKHRSTAREQVGEAGALLSRQEWSFKETLGSQRCKHCYVPGNLGLERRDPSLHWNVKILGSLPKRDASDILERWRNCTMQSLVFIQDPETG